GHENDLAITVSYVAPSGAILESDIVINTRHTFHVDASGCSHAYDLRSVVTHEVGHFYGLGEDTTDTETTMYYKTLACETKKRSLSDPDVETVAYLYEGALDELQPGVSCSASTSRPSSFAVVGLLSTLAALGLALRRRRPR
ncbi:MAG: matrixin family metalloprotease, partial [Myxococcota bacterium]